MPVCIFMQYPINYCCSQTSMFCCVSPFHWPFTPLQEPSMEKNGGLNPSLLRKSPCLVGWALPLWKMEWKSVGMMKFPTEWTKKKCSKPPTSWLLKNANLIGQETPRPTLEKCVSADRDSEIRVAPAVARHPVTKNSLHKHPNGGKVRTNVGGPISD